MLEEMCNFHAETRPHLMPIKRIFTVHPNKLRVGGRWFCAFSEFTVC